MKQEAKVGEDHNERDTNKKEGRWRHEATKQPQANSIVSKAGMGAETASTKHVDEIPVDENPVGKKRSRQNEWQRARITGNTWGKKTLPETQKKSKCKSAELPQPLLVASRQSQSIYVWTAWG